MTMPATAQPVVVAGATGFVGHALVDDLAAAGHDIRAMTRYPDRYWGPGRAVAGNVHHPSTLGAALEGSDIAYYLVPRSATTTSKGAAPARPSSSAAPQPPPASARSSTSVASAPKTRSSSRAPAVGREGRVAAGGGRRARHRATGGDRRRRRWGLVGDHPAARQEPAGHGGRPTFVRIGRRRNSSFALRSSVGTSFAGGRRERRAVVPSRGSGQRARTSHVKP